MTGAQFLTFIVAQADKSSSDSAYRALALDWLKLIYRDIQNRQQSYHWRFLEKTAWTNTVANQHSYDLPTDIDTNKVLSVYERDNDITLTFVPYERFVKFIADPSASVGIPQVWTVSAKSLRLYPIPSSSIRTYIDYLKVMTEPADDATALSIPAKYDNVILQGLLEWVYRYDPEMGNADNQHMIYESLVQNMIIDNGTSPAEEGLPESHRTRYYGGGAGEFPIAQTNF